MTNEKSNITSILLLRKKGEVTVSLVATIMPDKDYARSRPADAGPYWLDRLDRGFTGKVFYSAVNGRMIVGHVYENGRIVNDLVLRSKLLQHRHHDCDCNCDGSCGEACDCGCGGKCEGDCDHDHATEGTATKAGSAANLEILGYMTVTLADRTMATRWNGGTYWNEWEDDMWGCPGCSDRNCPWCMDSIVVIGHQPNYCYWCGNDPCTCFDYSCYYCGSYWCSGDCQNACTYCGSIYCQGECQYHPCSYCGNPFCQGQCQIIPPTLQPNPIDVMKVEIQRDCMGPTLIATCNTTGVAFVLSSVPSPKGELGSYSPSTNTITMYCNDDYVLLEEMIHNYQRLYRDPNEPYYKGNNEIEAKLLVWEYCKRTGQAEHLKYLSPNGWKKFAIFAENPTEANWGSALEGIGGMGYDNYPVSEFNDFKTDNYRKITCH